MSKIYHWEKSGHKQKKAVKTQPMKECSLLAHSSPRFGAQTSLTSYVSQDYLHRNGITHTGLDSYTLINNQDNHLHTGPEINLMKTVSQDSFLG